MNTNRRQGAARVATGAGAGAGGWQWRNIALLFAAFIMSRLIVIPLRVDLLVGSERYFDFRHYFELARMSAQGLYPHADYWVEYPPVFPWLTVVFYQFASAVTSALATETLFYSLVALLLVIAEAGVFVLVHRLSCLLAGPTLAWRSALIYTLCFIPLYLWNGWFDTLPTLLFLWSLYLLVTQRERGSAVLAGIGLMAKVFPGLVIPLAVCTLPGRRRKTVYIITALATVAVIALPLAIAGPTMFAASVRAMLGRSSWETIWAVMEGFFGFGVVAPFSERIDPATALAASHSSSLPWGLVTCVFGMLFLAFYWRFWGRRSAGQLVAAAGATLCLLLVYSKGYSPQYLTWLAPCIAVIFPTWRGIAYLGLLGLVNLAEYPGYFHFLPEQHALLAAAVIVRTSLLIVIGLDCARRALTGAEATHHDAGMTADLDADLAVEATDAHRA